MKKKGSLVLRKSIKSGASYARLIRFFKMPDKTTFILGLLDLTLDILRPYIDVKQMQVLSLDRTNWKLGKLNINILTIGLVLPNGRFLPLYFELLDKRGNSNQKERISLFSALELLFKEVLQLPSVLVADGEFIGKEWFGFLKMKSLDFVIRLRKKDYQQELASQMNISLEQLQHKIRGHIAKQGYFVATIELQGRTYCYHVLPLQGRKNDLSKSENDICIRFLITKVDTVWGVKQYDKRWKIEVFFEDIKEKGFILEQINFTDLQKIKLMVAISCLAYAICIKKGLVAYEKKPTKLKLDKKSGNSYPRVSIFTKGYELIEEMAIQAGFINQLINSFLPVKTIVDQIKLLSFSSNYFKTLLLV
jgi:hypothetical protein